MHYFSFNISRITIFTTGYLKFSIFSKSFQINRMVSFERQSFNYFCPPASIYVIFSERSRTVEELFKKIYKFLLETWLWEYIWRFFLWLLGQINVIFVFLAQNTVELHYIYWNIPRITIFTTGYRIVSIFSKYLHS